MGNDSSGRSVAADPVVGIPAALPAAWQQQLTSCVVDENVALPDAATLVFRDPNHELLTATGIGIGSELTVKVTTTASAAAEELFAGEVTALELDSDGTGSFTVVRAMSRAHRLMRGRKVKAFRNMTAERIVREVATGAKLKPGRIKAKPITYTQLSQANVSDWEFLQNLAQEHGVAVRVDGDGRLDFAELTPASKAPSPSTPANKSPFVLEYGRNLMALRAVLTAADQVDAVEVRGWNVDTKKPLVARDTSATSEVVRPGLTAAKTSSKFGKPELLVTDMPYGTQAEARTTAKALAASMRAGLGEVEAVAEGNPKLRAGVPVALGNVGEDFAGKYTATAVHHVLEPGQGYRTTVLVSASPDRSLVGLVAGAGAPDRGPRIPGVATGIVTDIKEPGKSERGWVKLKFPWLSDDYVTDWVRTVQLGGNGGGGVFSPDVDDEVLVGFEQGSLDHPYVIGGLYNGVDSPSEHDGPLVDRTSGKVNRRSLVSRKGHRLELIDSTTRSPGVHVASGNKRLDIRMDEQAQTVDITVRAPGGRRVLTSMSLSPTGIELDAGTGDITLSGRSISLDATTSVSIKGRTSVDIDGGATAALHAPTVRIN
ncbi:VgrG-related protein [Saccharopolyspora sp. TS4A08]|uniref:VgrG-related protein n=1 Tax=Saccharopolyspora ipomoeae TaxID=3042027 RepID=A0ABT6PVB7_9PSEU|nr:VgrG-related protein [Saccharopolyspora sp. TS4A08]MDI2031953.1 VgrG-related protein [Saccharopolyspora sp. TS4A08]